MKMISMNDPSTREFFLQMLERYIIFLLKKTTYVSMSNIEFLKQNFRDRYEYFWAGAKISRGTLFWENGRSERISTGKYLLRFYLILLCKFCRQSKFQFGSYQKLNTT